MALKFFNVRSGETRVAETEPQISALWGSSDRGPNANRGQDFGWRLAPEVVVELRRIIRDERLRLEIAKRYALALDAVGEKEILRYISDMTAPQDAPVADDNDYQDQYEQDIRNLSKKGSPSTEAGETQVRPSSRGKSNKK